MSLPAIELRGLGRSFGRVRAVDGLDLRVEEGSVFGFLGLNGAGKTTTLRLMLGLLRPRRGTVTVLGGSPRRDRGLLAQVGVLFEDFRAHPYLTGREHLRLRARLLGLDGDGARAAADEWIERVGLTAASRRRVRGYSQGMQRRLGLACALVHRPRLVLLDEPTNGLDPEGISDFRDVIVEANRASGTTFFLSSHILDEVEKVCDHIAIVHGGQLLRQGAVEDLTGSRDGRVRLSVGDETVARQVLGELGGCEIVPVDGAVPVDEVARRLVDGGEARVAGSLDLVAEVGRVPDIVRALVAAAVDVLEVRALTTSLEDVFRETIAAADDRGGGER